MLVRNVLFHKGRRLEQLLARFTSVLPFIFLLDVLLAGLAQFPATNK